MCSTPPFPKLFCAWLGFVSCIESCFSHQNKETATVWLDICTRWRAQETRNKSWRNILVFSSVCTTSDSKPLIMILLAPVLSTCSHRKYYPVLISWSITSQCPWNLKASLFRFANEHVSWTSITLNACFRHFPASYSQPNFSKFNWSW
jgi:hypothetical protein